MHTTHQRGYTLIEMLVVVAIILIVTPALFASIISLYKTHGATLAQSAAVTEATKASKEVVRDIRSAVYSESGSLPLVTTATSTLTLYADTDFDGRVERVRYSISSTTLEKGVIEPTATSTYPTNTETVRTLAQGIMNVSRGQPLFSYYTATSSPLTGSFSQLSVRRIQVQLYTVSPLGRQTSDVVVRSSASIRNLKDTY